MYIFNNYQYNFGKNLIYYLDITPIICFLIVHQLFILQIIYILVRRYLNNNLNNNNIDDNKNKLI